MTSIHVFLFLANLTSAINCLPVNAGHSTPEVQQHTGVSLFGTTFEVGKLHSAPAQPQGKATSLFGVTAQLGKPNPAPADSSAPTPTTRSEGTEGKSIRLFGANLQPAKSSASEANTLPMYTSDLKAMTSSMNANSPSASHIRRKKGWLDQYMPASQQDPYLKLIDRLNISHKYSVKNRFFKQLTSKERQDIESGNKEGIKKIIHSREYLVRYAPLEFPEDRRPSADRIERLKWKIANMRGKVDKVHGRKLKGWYNDHSLEEADAIRRKVTELHGRKTFEKSLNTKIASLTKEERIKALHDDEKALFKLGPLGIGRPSNKRKRRIGIDKAERLNTRMSYSKAGNRRRIDQLEDPANGH
jgi:hypothetical protein